MTKDKIYSKNPDVVFRRIADEFILVPIRQKAVDLKSIYTLNETAAFVWELIDGVRTAQQIKENVAEEFDVDLRLADSDITRMLLQLETLSFIKKSAS